jgi:hypothetical protein
MAKGRQMTGPPNDLEERIRSLETSVEMLVVASQSIMNRIGMIEEDVPDEVLEWLLRNHFWPLQGMLADARARKQKKEEPDPATNPPL